VKENNAKIIENEIYDKIKEISKTKNINMRNDITDEEIIERLMFPLINEGFKLLEEGLVYKPSDIDIVFR